MTCDTKYIQTLNLKLTFENWETLLKFLIWINTFQWIRYSTYYEKWKTNIYFVPSKVCFAVKNLPLEIEWKISCKKDQISCFSISAVVWSVFYRNYLRKLIKDFSVCRSGTNRSSVLVARGVMVQPASYFLYLFVTRRQQIETSFSCLRR